MALRNKLPDAARGTLILLVVWGHLIERNGFDSSLYFAIYIFHIPAFAMLSGMFSKPRIDASEALRITQRLLFPLIAFQILYYFALDSWAPDRLFGTFTTAWIIWFLLSLMTWKLILPLALRLPFPFVLSMFAVLIAGFFVEIGLEFSLSRTVVFFPAFLFGHLYGTKILAAVVEHRFALAMVFVTLLCVALLASEHVSIHWLWGARSYSEIPLETPGVIYRAVAISTGILASVAFLAIVPSRSRSLAFLGQNTMPVYLLHGFPVILFWTFEVQLGIGFPFMLTTAVLTLVISFSIAWIFNLLPALRSRKQGP